jgi:hypothetical protein
MLFVNQSTWAPIMSGTVQRRVSHISSLSISPLGIFGTCVATQIAVAHTLLLVLMKGSLSSLYEYVQLTISSVFHCDVKLI